MGCLAGLSQPCEWEHKHISLLTVTRPAKVTSTGFRAEPACGPFVTHWDRWEGDKASNVFRLFPKNHKDVLSSQIVLFISHHHNFPDIIYLPSTQDMFVLFDTFITSRHARYLENSCTDLEAHLSCTLHFISEVHLSALCIHKEDHADDWRIYDKSGWSSCNLHLVWKTHCI